jgi:RNA polymerase sigma factor (sigma-70 family)
VESWGTDSDEELLQRCREGAPAVRNTAYSALWERHHRAGIRSAQRLAPRLDAEDLVATAYLKIYEALAKGKGPQGAFRPYLYQVIKGVAADSYLPQEDTTDILDTVPIAVPDAPWDESSFDLDAAAQAFASLPARWQTVLWYTVVEQLPPREVAKLMQLSPNAVSALAIRAREALQSAWVDAHIKTRHGSPECEFALRHVERLHRGRLTARVKREVEAHIGTCPTCARASSDIRTLNEKLALLLTAIFVGSGSATLLSGFGRSEQIDVANATTQPGAARARQAGHPASANPVSAAPGAVSGAGSAATVGVAPVLMSTGITLAVAVVGAAVFGVSMFMLRGDASPPLDTGSPVSTPGSAGPFFTPEPRRPSPDRTSDTVEIRFATEQDGQHPFQALVEPEDDRTDDDHDTGEEADENEEDADGEDDGEEDGAPENEPDDGGGDEDETNDGEDGDDLEDPSIVAGFDCSFDNGEPGAVHPSGNSNQYGALRARLSGPGTGEAKLLVPPGNESVDDGRGNVFTDIFSGTDPEDPWWWWAPSLTPLTQWGEEFDGLSLGEVTFELRLVVPDGRYSPWTIADLSDSECS